MSTNVEKIVENFCDLNVDKEQKDKLFNELKQGFLFSTFKLFSVVLKKEIELNTIVKILGPFLTSDDENTRSRGYEIFSGSLEWVEDSDVSEQNAASLMKFYSNRINDFLCLPDIIPGALTCIQKFSNVKKDDAVNFMIQLFSEASVMSLAQPVRLGIFQILNTILVKFPESKKEIF
jgi:hypothetical protein